MKRYFYVIVIAILFNGGMAQAGQISLELPTKQSGSYGQNISVPVILSSDSLINEVQFVFAYDSTIIKFTKITLHKDAESYDIEYAATNPPFETSTPNTNKNLLVHLYVRGSSYLSGADVGLIEIHFNIAARRGETPIVFDEAEDRTYVQTIEDQKISGDLISFTHGYFMAEEEATAVLSLKTDTPEVQAGSQLKIIISIDQVHDLHSFDLSLKYDPTHLAVLSVEEGSFLNQNMNVSTSWNAPAIDNINGSILNIESSRLIENGLNGSGNLIIINFSVIGIGVTAIDFLQNECGLFDPLDRTIAIKEFANLTVTAIGDPTVLLSVPDANGILNQIVDIPVYISEISDFSIISALISITVDSNVLHPLSIVAENSLTAEWYQPTLRVDGGTITFALAGFAPLTADGTLIYLRCRVNERAEDGDTSTVALSYVLLNEGDPGVVTENGLFRAIGLQVSGHISYSGTLISVPGAEVRLSGDFLESAISGQSGNYSFTQLRYGSYRLTPTKENDQGNSVTPFDAALVLQHIVQLTKLSGYQLMAANVTGDTTVSALDASHILSYSVGLIQQFPVMSDSLDFWRFIPEDFAINDSNWFQHSPDIEYEPLDRNYFNQNFLSIIRGDVSQNWQPLALSKQVAQLPKADSSPSVSFGVVEKLGQNQFRVPVILQSDTDVAAVQLEIRVASESFKFTAAEKSDLSNDFILVHNVIDDVIKIAMASAYPLTVDGDFVYLRFETTGEMFNPCEFISALINENQHIITTDAPDVDIPTTLPDKFILLDNYPNPFNNQTLIQFCLPRPSYIELNVFNLSGARVKSLFRGYAEAGGHNAVWHGDDGAGHPVSTGTYIIRLNSDSGQVVRKVLFLK